MPPDDGRELCLMITLRHRSGGQAMTVELQLELLGGLRGSVATVWAIDESRLPNQGSSRE